MTDDPEPPTRASPPIGKWIGVAAAVIAPTTLITGLCYYFGYVATRQTYAYFDIDTTLLGFSSNEYVVRSVSVLYTPFTGLVVAACVGMWLHQAVKHAVIVGRMSPVRRIGLVCLTVGGTLLGFALFGIATPGIYGYRVGILIPLALGVGAVLFTCGWWMSSVARTGFPRHSVGLPERAGQLGSVLLITVSLFWLANILAARLGVYQAENVVSGLDDRPHVVLDVTERLYIPIGALAEIALPQESGQTYRYRYEQLRLLTIGTDRWFLIPATWTKDAGFILVVPMDGSARVRIDTNRPAE